MNSNTKTGLPLKVMVGYGSAGYATLFTFTIVITYGLYFFTDVVGLSAGFAGMLLSIGTFVDAVTDPLIGTISDKRNPRKGRRRPFLLAAAIPFGIVTWLLFTDWGFGQAMSMVYFAVLIIMFYVVQTLVDVPYTALGSEMTLDYDERTKLSSIRYSWATVGGIVSGFTMAITAYLGELFDSARLGWSVANLMFGVLCTITILIAWKATKGRESTEMADVEPFNLAKAFKGPFSNKSFRHVALSYLFGIVGQTVAVSVTVYYMSYNLQLSDNQISAAMVIMWVVAFFWIALTNHIALKYSKKAAWNFSMVIWIATLFIFVWIINAPGNAIAVYVMTSIYVVGYNAIYQVTWASIPDCVEVDEFRTGQRKEGLYYSMASLTQKLGSAIAVAICGWIITWMGYDPGLAEQSQTTLTGFAVLLSAGTSFFLLLSIISTATNPMTKERHAAIKEAIALKEAGKPYSTEKFKELL